MSPLQPSLEIRPWLADPLEYSWACAGLSVACANDSAADAAYASRREWWEEACRKRAACEFALVEAWAEFMRGVRA